MIKPIIAALILLSAPYLITQVADSASYAMGKFECKFDEERMAEVKAAMPDQDVSVIEQQLSGKSCTEAVKWIDASWKQIHKDTMELTDD